MLDEQHGAGNNWNTNLAFWINAAKHMCHAHVMDNIANALEERSVVWSI